MRMMLLAAAMLAGSSAASAAPTVYGLSFIGTDLYAERPDQPAAQSFQRDFTGTLTFDPVTNQVLNLDAEFTGPNRDFTLQTAAILNAGQPCDLQCLVGALENGSFYFSYGTVASSVTFGAPLSGTAFLPGVTFYSRPLSITGNIQFNGAVPEPGTWLMMLLGFGGIGLGLRRRKPAQLALSL